jgi:hypothetical protein
MNNTQLFDLKSCEWNLFPILERFTLYLHSNKDNQLFPLMNLRFLLLLIIVQPTVEDLSLVEEEIEVADRTSYGRGKGPRVCSRCGNW